MKTRSRKIKGKRLTNYVRDKILKAFPHLKKKDVMVPTDGQNGPDIILSRIAKKLCPYNWELKNQQKMATVYKWHRQASKNTKLTPIVVCKMNTRDPLVILDLDHFMSLIRQTTDTEATLFILYIHQPPQARPPQFSQRIQKVSLVSLVSDQRGLSV